MPATINAKIWLSIKTRGDLKTAWIGLAHRLIDFSQKALILCEKRYWECKKKVFWKKSYVRHAGMHSKTETSVGFMFSYDLIWWFFNARPDRGTWWQVNWVNITIPTSSLLLRKCDKYWFFGPSWSKCPIYISIFLTLPCYYGNKRIRKTKILRIWEK